MRSKLATAALATAIGLTGLGGAVVLAPAVSYAATGDSTALTDRVTSLTSALSGLVTDGSITQAQADEVATTLAEARPFGRGGRGPGGRLDLAAAAEALGLTEDELRTRTQAGETLADVADAEGVDQADVVAALVTAEQARLDQAVVDGRLTQAQADERKAALTERITERLDELCGPGGRGGDDDDDEAATPAPSADTSTTTTDPAA